MENQLPKVIITIIVILALGGGGYYFYKKNAMSSSHPNTNAITELEGQWSDNCTKVGTSDISARNYFIIKGNTYTLKTSNYIDLLCEKEILTNIETGTFNILGAMAQDATIKRIDFNVGETKAFALTKEVVTLYNSEPGGFCGYPDWNVGDGKVISGRTCRGGQILPAGSKGANIYKVEGTVVYWGDRSNMVKEPDGTQRPVRLQPRAWQKDSVTAAK